MIRVYIEDKKKGVIFAYIKDVPAICSQGKTKEEVDKMIDRYFEVFNDKRMGS